MSLLSLLTPAYRDERGSKQTIYVLLQSISNLKSHEKIRIHIMRSIGGTDNRMPAKRRSFYNFFGELFNCRKNRRKNDKHVCL